MPKIHIEEFFKDDNLRKIKNILKDRAIFLNEVEKRLSKLFQNNPEIFRREPTSRVKKIRSIRDKLNNPKKNYEVDSTNLFLHINEMKDIAGIRLTIATKDLFNDADTLLHSVLDEIGTLIKDEKTISKTHSYSAVHYDLTSKDKINKCEIQVRTLTQDLWAVFSHYESYKKEEINELNEEELENYAKLMDVADDYAQTIRRKKIIEAEIFHAKEYNNLSEREKKFSPVLTYKAFEEILFNQLSQDSKMKNFETLRRCDIFRNLSENKIFSVQDLTDLVSNKTYKDYIRKRMEELNLQGGEYDDFYILCQCYKRDKEEVKSYSHIPIAMISLIDGLINTIKAEEEADNEVKKLLDVQ